MMSVLAINVVKGEELEADLWMESSDPSSVVESVEPECSTIGFIECQLYQLVNPCPESYFCHNSSAIEKPNYGLCRRVKETCVPDGKQCCHDIDCCIENELTAPLNCVDQICRVLFY
ncbi:unnamed protein product [Medioppia subpectinata]|uniref:Uncharacterized protein n=1 Tax=Medioppia subpectinata TaxID=1979941 RepID=A0A7R9L8N4_9ACAR|nr:unnamed protein product [Medioppia subpectinata]CAG2116435.1 unnamed protein product [Medioppia subpectinata]